MSSNSKTAAARETLYSAYLTLLDTTHWTHAECSRRMGISGKTLRRYLSGVMPPPARARDMVHLLTGIDPVLHARFAAYFGVPITPPPPPTTAAPDPSRAKGILEAAVFEASDQQNLPPGTTRAVGRILLEAIHHAGLDVLTARELLAAKPKRA